MRNAALFFFSSLLLFFSQHLVLIIPHLPHSLLASILIYVYIIPPSSFLLPSSSLPPSFLLPQRIAPQSLLVSNIAGERMVMVPNYPLNRPKQKICPFTCDLVQMRQISVFGSYIYPVHVGGSFTLFPTLASTFYWIALQVGKGDDGRMGVCVCV